MNAINSKSDILKVYAGRTANEDLRFSSSSGGVFSELARRTIESGGVVFGSRFNNRFDVVCDYTENVDGIAHFRGSKYVMSHIDNAYADAFAFLKQGRKVLFTGTPCQIAGLRKYVKDDYDNLITLEVVCHGVPDNRVWRKYLETFSISPDAINFRTKPEGWLNYHIKIGNFSERYTQNPYMRAFLSDVSLREACYHCKVKGGMSGADITLGDFWGIDHIHPEINDDKGLSLLIVHTVKGLAIVNEADLILSEEKYEEALRFNPSIEKTAGRPVYRDIFMRTLSRKGFNKAFELIFSPSLINRMRRRILLILNK